MERTNPDGAAILASLDAGWAERKLVKLGTRVGIFPLPRGDRKLAAEPPKDELSRGDAVLLPIFAEVVSRFMKPGEKEKRSYQRWPADPPRSFTRGRVRPRRRS